MFIAVRGGKLQALEYVRSLFGIPRNRCIAAGDSGNDILMLAGVPSSPHFEALNPIQFNIANSMPKFAKRPSLA